MKVLPKSFHLVAPVILVSGLGMVPTAHGAYGNASGSVCKNHDTGDANYMNYSSYGISSFKASPTLVTCPLTRLTNNSNGAVVYIDVKNKNSATVACTAYSYSYTKDVIASASQTWTGSGFHELTINISGAGKSDYYSDYSVLCTIPGNNSSTIYDIDLNEY